ncbi:MAG: hypothetical protein M0D55_12930 [Elusimicrobiota bacterium]|nr:MAG: hypothetical protein M0D55_12930 [Elusimicrobiota bacterium]
MRLAAAVTALAALAAFAPAAEPARKRKPTIESSALPPEPGAPSAAKKAAAPEASAEPVPPRPAGKGCLWRTLSAPQIGLEALVQRCNFGYRTIDFAAGKRALIQIMQDAGKDEDLYPVVVMYEKKEDEAPDDAIRRAAFGKLSRYQRKHCRVVAKHVPHLGLSKAAFTIEPDEVYAEKIAKENGTDIPPPPCGDMGISFDGVSYWEFHAMENPRRFAFVNAGQDSPLFDETGLKFLP